MKKYLGIIAGVVLTIFAFIAVVVIAQGHNKIRTFDYQTVVNASGRINYESYGIDSVLPAGDASGNIGEKIEGEADSPIIIYEYADYACSHCSEANLVLNKLVKDYDGKVAVVFRGYLINYFRNNVIAASAATAAQLQGYWEKYKDLLFENQATWYYMSGNSLREYLGELFKEASDNQGDLDKFYQDLNSEEVSKRVAFEYGLGNKAGVEGTPTLRINGEVVSPSEIRETVENYLNNLK